TRPSATATPKKSARPTRTVVESVAPVDAEAEDSLAKTGDGYVLPLLTVGIGLILGGGITLRASRRSGYLRDDL
ncbi:hypothetical protein C1I98_33620, partial [Spongiactinospora gelatinilytica]